jgi:hypothetical protein
LKFAAAIGCLAFATGAAAAPNLGRLTPIPLQTGVNRIAQFSSDGREARIVLAWRDNGNAHGYDVFLVLMPTKRGGTDWNVVGLETGQSFSDEIRDAPHTGEDVATAVRFVRRGTKPLVVMASRRIVESYPAPAETMIKVYELRRSDGVPGTTIDYFAVTRQWKARERYCNAELALHDEVGLPLRKNYQGTLRTGGC